jgi:hypothetical protein
MNNSYKSYQKQQDIYLLVKKIQINGTVFYQEFEKNVFNPIQEKLYLPLVYGLKAFSEEKLEKIPNPIKQTIVNKHKEVQRLLNKWKHEITNKSIDKLLLSLFPKSKIAKEFANTKGCDETMLCRASLKDVKLDKITIAKKLIENNYLPKNFFQLK